MKKLIDCYGFDAERNKVLFPMYGVDPAAGKIYNKETGKEIVGGLKSGYRVISLRYYGIDIKNMRSTLVYESANKDTNYGIPKHFPEKWFKICRQGFDIDHINARKDDDRIENLDLITRKDNRNKSNKVGEAA